MDILQAVVLAAVQGVTAWIPVSSKTQVILAGGALFSTPFKTALAFALLLHLGDLLAALWKYKEEYWDALKKLPQHSTYKTAGEIGESPFLIISIACTALLALPLYVLSSKFFSALPGELLLAAVGVLLLVMTAITFHSRKQNTKPGKVSFATATITGFAQALAVLPGISRSGITQCSLLLQGVSPEKAVRLSFLMSAPMIAASFAAFYFLEGFQGFTLEVIAIGIAVSAIASLLMMDVMTRLARTLPSHYFTAAIGVLALMPFLVKSLLGLSA